MAIKRLLQVFKQRLTNLSSNNRSLLLLRLYAGQQVDLHQLNFAAGKPPFEILSQLVTGKNRIVVCPVTDAWDAASNRLSYQLKQLQRTTEMLLEEQGAEHLCIGYPFIQGRFNNEVLVRCPLLLFPVQLTIERNNWIIQPRPDIPVTFNKTFLLAYAHHNEQPLNELLNEWTFHPPAEDVLVFLTQLYHLINNSGLELHFNADNFSSQLLPFQTFTKRELELTTATGRLKLMPEAVLGQFPQADSYLAPDYDALLADNHILDLEDFFNKNTTFRSPKEEELITPYPVDAAQYQALQLVKSGQSLVVQGPPGTGKSQLIVNLIADAISSGKRLLVVCQKKAALDVVYQRLQEKELHLFAALVHDFQQDRPRIYSHIAAQIQQVQQKHRQQIDISILQHERRFVAISRRIAALEEELEEFRRALYDESLCGISAKTLYLTSSPCQPYVIFNQQLRSYFDAQQAARFLPWLQRYVAYARRTQAPESLWRERFSFAGKNIADLHQFTTLLKEVPHQVAALKETLRNCPLTKQFANKTWQEVFHLCHSVEEIKIRLLPFAKCARWQQYNAVALQWLEANDALLPEDFLQKATALLTALRPIQQWHLSAGEIPIATQLLQAYLRDQQHGLGKIKWLFSTSKKQIHQWLLLHHLPRSTHGATALLHKIAAYRKACQIKEELERALPFLPYPTDWNFHNWEIFFERTRQYCQLLDSWKNFSSNWLKDFDISTTEWYSLPEQLQQMAEIFRHLIAWQSKWSSCLTPAQQELLWQSPEKASLMAEQLEALFEDLCAIDTLQLQLNHNEQEAINLLSAYKPDNPDSWVSIFDNSWRISWLLYLEECFPILRKASSEALLQAASELQELLVEKEQLSLPIARWRAWERAFSNLEYNRLHHLVSYRNLLHQVSKKRNIWSLRKLISVHWEELANLIPCWLVSPESASALFPMQTLFDIVVFDEASQCFAEKGIPAMYRGKQVVIVGDDKQLPPFDLYRLRWEVISPEEEVAPELEIESLLDLGKRYLPQVILTKHYRSRYPELIHFSNQHFYQNKLQLLPYRHDWQPNSKPIHFVKVEGIWEKQTNRIEAEKVLQIVSNQLEQEPTKTIGIITFNVHQQELILDLLEQSGLVIPPSLFVKNIENVQGDERDCIIFSIGYAPSSSGKFQLHFGSLNQSKGENRLNVAITRAREKIIIVSSIYPQQLQTHQATHPGPHLLRAYLQYAYSVASGKFELQKATAEPVTENTLAACLQKTAKHLQNGFPFADLIAIDPQGNPTKLILTDDFNMLRAISARDIFALQPLHFKHKGWQLEFAFSRNWWKGSTFNMS
ncbi:MAG: ATP-binding protein [Cytophagales bacterium]|nr:AAA domain-containing protein [Bernardetiaceae bacterium]MDW8211134.1 ATP-binding protein [Cytophagales bacterium]